MRVLQWAGVVLVAAVLAACGGGGQYEVKLTVDTGNGTVNGTVTPGGTVTPTPSIAGSANFATGVTTGMTVTGTITPDTDPYTGTQLGAKVTAVGLAVSIPVGTATHVVTGYASPTSGTGTFFQLDDGSSANRVTVRMAAFQLYATTVVSGVQKGDVYLGRVLPTTLFNVGLSLERGVTYNGKPLASLNAADMPPLTRIQLGAGAAGQWNATIANYERRTTTLFPIPAGGLFDDFDRADGSIGLPPTGQQYVQAVPWPNDGPRAENWADIGGKMLITRDSGISQTASYNGVDMQIPVTQFMAAVAYSPGARGFGNATLIAQGNGLRQLSDITNGAIHIGFLDNAVQIQKLSGGIFTVLRNFPYSRALALDGTTVYNVGWRIVGSKMVLLLPDGTFVEYTDPVLIGLGGRYAIFESYWQGAAAPRSQFAAVSIQ